MPPFRSPAARIALAAAAFCTASPAAAQLIQIKTLPIADGDQFQFFPSATIGLGGVSIALRDSLLDPFTNPAKASRLSEKSKGTFFGSPTSYSVSRNAGGGRTFPLGGIFRSGSSFGGIAVAIQEIDKIDDPNVIFSPVVDLISVDGTALPQPATPSRQNRFAFGTIGRVFERAGVSVGLSALASSLRDIDGVDLLYAGSRGVRQHGGELDVRLGLLKEWSSGRSMEAMLLHDRFNMAQDVSWADQVWDPNARTFGFRERVDHNLDRTNTWGLHLGYSQPLADSGWRVGGIITTNLASHPKLPDYQISQVMTIPWDPGHSAAYDLGVGLAKSSGLTTFGVDAVFEPIRTHTWGEAPSPIVTDTRTLPAGAKTTENFFAFSNAILRTGLGRDIPIDTVHGALKSVRLELGLALRSINYTLNQFDHVAETNRQQDESWMEWTRTWGFGLRFSDLELRYTGRMSTGDGRPGIQSFDGRVALASADAAGKNFLSAPSGSLSLTGVKVTTHQISVSVPIR
jgi:hypothetical protein